ncbi:serine/threonine protein kinase [Streptomyces sp. CHA1]|uniref:serine/threonine-protein kinase n=1 Tax=unclassified Streptomyces TaxID=2593676 RepID=UPI001BFCA025|nr:MULTISPECIES: serine/threonine-protein kinase [unclassified Streptomyces]MBT3157086.1 serine/threonine protein kinase [Streptomyces sp. G11C]MCO6701609.1 serine/threonine protein kinase [Streptomyces sp. CHB9.2]MCO6707861.1 serine/threonine protein kinase [Streptomyces sp. CHA3]MCO6713602.1 serine/threonine protein kinase [Streptomyces sp. CHB19.2]MCO6719932.1 serine/threonine protein kinase [Streptomyces sp. Vc714c-19]
MGRVVDDRFELIARLGGGGMGLVWRARDLALHREVALKEVRPPDPALLESDPTAARMLRERVLREARSLARIDHPNVVTIHHIVDSAEVAHPWLVMELVTGGSLQDKLGEGRMAPAEAARLGRGVLAALRAAHAAGIHHRDVKPANVLLRPDGRPVLTDFGIAALRESTSLTATGELVGSPDYIAPERLRGDEGNPASDLWSLGMLLYVAVEGHHPLRRASTLATLAAVLDGPIPEPRYAGALFPVLEALLTRDAAARPGAEALDALLARAEAEAEPGSGRGSDGADDEVAGQTWRLGAVPPQPTGSALVRTPTQRVEPEDAPPQDTGAAAAAATTVPASEGPATPLVTDEEDADAPTAEERARARRLTRRTRIALSVSSVLSTAMVVGGFYLFGPGSDRDPGRDDRAAAPSSTPSAPSMDPVEDATPRPEESPEKETSLLTPESVRRIVSELEKVMGTTKVTAFDVHQNHASAKAPLQRDPKLWDTYEYRDGKAVRASAGGVVRAGDAVVDLDRFDWDALPGLMTEAEKRLGVDKPENRYLIVDPASPFHDKQPVLRLYLSDEYGGGHLTADVDGKVIDVSPRS